MRVRLDYHISEKGGNPYDERGSSRHRRRLSGRHAAGRLRRRQAQDQGQRGLHGRWKEDGHLHGRLLPVRQQHRRRVHDRTCAEGLRGLGHERHLVRPGRIDSHDTPCVLRTAHPQDHGRHDPRGHREAFRKGQCDLLRSPEHPCAVLPDLQPGRGIRRSSSPAWSSSSTRPSAA